MKFQVVFQGSSITSQAGAEEEGGALAVGARPALDDGAVGGADDGVGHLAGVAHQVELDLGVVVVVGEALVGVGVVEVRAVLRHLVVAVHRVAREQPAVHSRSFNGFARFLRPFTNLPLNGALLDIQYEVKYFVQ